MLRETKKKMLICYYISLFIYLFISVKKPDTFVKMLCDTEVGRKAREERVED